MSLTDGISRLLIFGGVWMDVFGNFKAVAQCEGCLSDNE